MKRPVPKYILISKEIIQKIESGELLPGDKVPSENELIKEHNVSNTTARKSLHEVELQGWATRIKGRGTYVLNKTEDRHVTRVLGSFDAMKNSFDGNLIKEGFKPKDIILEKTILESGLSSKIDNRHMKIDGPVLKVHRLRYADDTLMKDETRYISLVACPKIHLIELKDPLIAIYEDQYKLKLGNAHRTMGAVILSPGDPQNYFENTVPLAAFMLDGAIFSEDGRIVEIERSLYRGDRYKFSINTKHELD
ncbi:MAG: GntR family transcriptional regulator [Imperialibacter sp.]|uniref:GntR family transcriptional regulator n=1 Tax=Imperialibacter sp. TaxID=2038411 RepID=UPI0032F89F63